MPAAHTALAKRYSGPRRLLTDRLPTKRLVDSCHWSCRVLDRRVPASDAMVVTWRHSLFGSGEMLVSITLTVLASCAPSLVPVAALSWLLWGGMLARVLGWFRDYEDATNSATVWGATVVSVLLLMRSTGHALKGAGRPRSSRH